MENIKNKFTDLDAPPRKGGQATQLSIEKSIVKYKDKLILFESEILILN